MVESLGATVVLADYVVGASFDDVPTAVVRESVRSLLNWAGCAIGGSGHETVDRALAAVSPFAGEGVARLFGRVEKTDPLNAALLNGISSHVFDFDDTHLKTIIHPAGPVASCLLALAEVRPMTGAELLHAFILGVEVECRIGNAVYPAHYDIGWHITGTAGVFGAAAAAGKILGLDRQQMVWALGIAGTQSSGFREMFGTMCKSFHPGRAAQNGIASALLGGWSVSAIIGFESGFPIAVASVTNNTNLFTRMQRPNATGAEAVTDGDRDDRILGQWLNQASYVVPAAFTLGTAPRTNGAVRSPHRNNVDLAVAKGMSLGGDRRGDLRLEVINLTNTVKVIGPIHQAGAAGFGQIRTQSGFMRLMQVMYRVTF